MLGKCCLGSGPTTLETIEPPISDASLFCGEPNSLPPPLKTPMPYYNRDPSIVSPDFFSDDLDLDMLM